MPNETVDGNLRVTGTLDVDGATTLRSTLYVDGFSRLGAAAVQGALTTSGDATLSQGLTVGASASIGGDVQVQGATSLASLAVSGTSSLGSTSLRMPTIRVESGPTASLTQEDSGSVVILVAGEPATVSLPSQPKAGTVFWFVAHDTQTYTVDFSSSVGNLWFANLTQTFDGVTQAVSDGTPRGTLAVVFEGTNWFGVDVANGWAGNSSST